MAAVMPTHGSHAHGEIRIIHSHGNASSLSSEFTITSYPHCSGLSINDLLVQPL
jgi:hypothetical protein